MDSNTYAAVQVPLVSTQPPETSADALYTVVLRERAFQHGLSMAKTAKQVVAADRARAQAPAPTLTPPARNTRAAAKRTAAQCSNTKHPDLEWPADTRERARVTAVLIARDGDEARRPPSEVNPQMYCYRLKNVIAFPDGCRRVLCPRPREVVCNSAAMRWFQEAVTQFHARMGRSTHALYQLLSPYLVERWTSPTTAAAYAAERARLIAAGRDTTEVWVFHGTDKAENIESIMRNGFRVTHTPANGRDFGDGVYASTTTASALFYSGNTRALIMSRMLVGKCDTPPSSNAKGAPPPDWTAAPDADSARPRTDWLVARRPEAVRPEYVIIF